MFVPVIFSGAGWTQQLLLQNVAGPNISARGRVTFHQADGSPWLISPNFRNYFLGIWGSSKV